MSTKIAPVVITQNNAPEAIGMSADRFLDFVRRHPTLPRVKQGKLVLVRASEIEALLAELATKGEEPVAQDVPQTENEVLGKLGLRKTA